MLKHFRIKDPAIFCTSCTGTIEGVIEPLTVDAGMALHPAPKNPKKFTYETNAEAKTLTIHVTADKAEEIKKAVQAAAQGIGFFHAACIWEELDTSGHLLSTRVSPLAATPAHVVAQPVISPSSTPLPTPPQPQKSSILQHLAKGLPSILLGALWISLPFLPISSAAWLSMAILGLAIVSTLIIAYAGWEIFQRTFIAARRRHITMDTQFAVSVFVALVISWVAFGVTGLSFLFDAGLLILGFRHIGLAIEEWAKNKIDKGNSLLDTLPKTVEVLSTGDEEKAKFTLPTYALIPKNIIRIYAGTKIPVDGVCLSKQVAVSACDFSGQTDSFVVKQDGKLLQGYQVTSGFVDVEVERGVAEATQAQLQKQTQEAAGKRMAIVTTTNRIGANFVKGIFLVTFLAFGFVALYSYFVLGIALGVALTLGLKTALGVLVSACPCTLGSIVPLIGKVGTYKCLKQGATLLDANVLDTTAKARHIVFDLNGTLTTGEKEVKEVRFLRGMLDEKLDAAKVLAYVKFLESKSEHLAGRAIYTYLKKKCSDQNLIAEEEKQLELLDCGGVGLGAKLEGGELLIGSRDLLAQKRIVLPETLPHLSAMMQRIYIAYAGKVIGYIDIHEPIRDEALETLNYFRNQGIGVKLCTGADKDTAAAYARQLGFNPEDVKAGCAIRPQSEEKPHPKVVYIQSLQQSGAVMFVGDAGNDTLPIAEAEVGIAVASPTMSEANKTGANVYIGQRSLWPLVKMHAIAKQTVFNIKWSLGFSLFYNLASFVFMGGLALFWLGFAINPGLGAAVMVGQALVVLLFAAVFRAWPVPSRAEVVQPSRAPIEADERNAHNPIDVVPTLGISRPIASPQISKQSDLAPSTSFAEGARAWFRFSPPAPTVSPHFLASSLGDPGPSLLPT